MNQVWDWILKGIGHLVAALKDAISGMVGKVLSTFGLTMVTFNALLPNLKAFVMQYVTGLPAHALELLGALGVGIAFSMILSALTIRMAWKVFIVPKGVADALGAGS